MTDKPSQERILVIDDELGVREGCRRVLEPAGYAVATASSGHEGLRLLREQPVDLVLLDVVMPDVRGIDLLGPIHELDPDIVCVIITGFATVELAVQAIKAGAYHFLSKPFSADLLLLAVQQGMERRRLSLETKRLHIMERETADLTRAKEELERLDKFKTTFMFTVAHELRAPLSAIQSFLVAMLKGYVPPDKRDEMLQRTVERTSELLELVDDLLKLSAAKNEQKQLRREVLSLADPLEKVFALQRVRADEKRIACRLEIRQRPRVEANADQMVQLWTNLISNAIKYTPVGGRVAVGLAEKDGWAVGTVQDTGIGISPDDQARIFDEFYRTPQAKEFELRGTGLGLPLVKRIIEAHGGTIEVESQLRQGSRFTFRLPVAT
ncbi:MAG: hybrid sensor histidine kinase/response regulator [Chloroflexi bacterium]|nr:hybrid sensor histidine kinase/response regulator [Chloroflexota bacterium]MBU1750765.1 hybrid sensor histidine kinase/response regulator [Chloroflexota bacterium]